MTFRRLFAGGLAAAVLAAGSPAIASTLTAADFHEGQVVGLGLTGLSYDRGFARWDVGADVATDLGGDRMKLGTRGLYRFFQLANLDAAVVGGLEYDPGTAGSRAYLVPDLGLSVAYLIENFLGSAYSLSVRLNMTITANQYLAAPSPTDLSPQPNLFQRLTFGPNTLVGVGLHLSKNFELTAGGGTWVGGRLNF